MSAMSVGVTSVPCGTFAIVTISASLVSVLPCTRTSTTRSAGWAAKSASVSSAASTGSRPAGNADLRLHVGLAVVLVLQRVAHLDVAEGEEQSNVHVDAARQPDVRERLRHRHRRRNAVELGEPLGGEEIPAKI